MVEVREITKHIDNCEHCFKNKATIFHLKTSFFGTTRIHFLCKNCYIEMKKWKK